MINVVLTGATGFVGTSFTKYFLNNGTINLVPVNLRKQLSAEKLASANTIIHLAGKAHDLKNTSDNSEYFKVNTELTKELFDQFLNSDVGDFIYFSSVKAVADTVDGVLLESTVPNPLTPYGRSKQKAEEYLLSMQLPHGKRLFIIRPCMIHGPGNKGNLNLLYQIVSKGIPYPLGAFNNSRSFLSVSNLCYVIERLMLDRSILGGTYNVADDQPLSTNEVIRIISKALDQKPRLWEIYPGLIKILATIGDKMHLPLNTERLTKLTEDYVVSNDKIKSALSIDNLPTSSKEGLFTTIKSFIAH